MRTRRPLNSPLPSAAPSLPSLLPAAAPLLPSAPPQPVCLPLLLPPPRNSPLAALAALLTPKLDRNLLLVLVMWLTGREEK
jgi:hypothetical protein